MLYVIVYVFLKVLTKMLEIKMLKAFLMFVFYSCSEIGLEMFSSVKHVSIAIAKVLWIRRNA